MEEFKLLTTIAADLEAGNAVGWFQGRMEFGPRALGARSILADPRSPAMQSTLNLKVKRRESFRPFAPAVTVEAAPDWFDLSVESPYMLLVADVVRSDIPAVTHVDNSARVQTVRADQHPRFHALLRAFEDRTGCPVLVNTSFNVRGEPIVCNPEDAYRCFMGTNIDILAIGDCYLRKEDQPRPISACLG
jgi:carbamoyltransferase